MAQFPDDQFEHPRRAVRDASRTVRHIRFGGRHHDTPVFFGVAMVGLGILFLLDNFHIVEARYVFRTLWPLLIVTWGLSRVLYGQGGEKLFGVAVAAFGALLLGDRLFGWDINVMGVFWPLLLIGFGLNMLLRPRRRRQSSTTMPPVPPLPGTSPDPPYAGFNEPTDNAGGTDRTGNVDQSASFREVAILSGIERRNVSQTFRGGTITAVMGSVELDLRDCRMAEDSANVSVQAIMGQIVLRLPPNWTVDSHLATVLGNLEDRSDRQVERAPKRLIIDGSVFMGQVEIRN